MQGPKTPQCMASWKEDGGERASCKGMMTALTMNATYFSFSFTFSFLFFSFFVEGNYHSASGRPIPKLSQRGGGSRKGEGPVQPCRCTVFCSWAELGKTRREKGVHKRRGEGKGGRERQTQFAGTGWKERQRWREREPHTIHGSPRRPARERGERRKKKKGPRAYPPEKEMKATHQDMQVSLLQSNVVIRPMSFTL